MAVKENPDGRWYCYYRQDGKIKREYFGRGLEGKAAAQRRDLEPKSSRHPDLASHSPTFQEVAVSYQQAKAAILPKPTQENLYYHLAGVIFPLLGHLPINQIDHRRLDEFVFTRLRTIKSISIRTRNGTVKRPAKDGATIKRTTVHRELSDIRAIINWAVARDIIDRSPMIGYEFPTRDDEIITPPSEEEISAILNHAAPHLQRAISLSYYTGLRPGAAELLNIKWSDINWQHETIMIRAAQKGGKPTRTIPLHPELTLLLKAWQKPKQSDHIIEYDGRPVLKLKTSWDSAKKKAGITRRLRMYDIRHGFVTALLEGGADLKTVAELIGDRPETMVKHYQHVTGQLRRQTILQLPTLGNTVLPESPAADSQDKE